MKYDNFMKQNQEAVGVNSHVLMFFLVLGFNITGWRGLVSLDIFPKNRPAEIWGLEGPRGVGIVPFKEMATSTS